MSVDLQNPGETSALFQQAAEAVLGDPKRDGSLIRLPAVGQLVISGDLHDHLIHLEKIRQLSDLDGNSNHHVLLQELIHGPRLTHGCDVSYRMLAKVAQDILAWPGQVHVVLGNHELAQTTRAGVSKGAGNNVELFNDGLVLVFGTEWTQVAAAIDTFIEALPLAVATETGLFCSHSLPAVNAIQRFDASVLDRIPTAEDRKGPWGSAYLMVWGRQFTPAHLDRLAQIWDVTQFCVGHAWVEMGVEQIHPNVIAVNSDHERGVVIPWDLTRKPDSQALIAEARYLQAVRGLVS